MKTINKMKINRSFIFSIIIGVILLILLSNMIFTIEVSHTDNYLKELVLKELNKYGIKEYRFKKSFDELTDIKNKILEDNKKIIEWLEIEVSGTKYTVKIEERKINNKKEDNTYQDIISTRDAVIKNIVASNGVVVCDINDYVKKGDTLISGSIYLNDTLKGYTKAEGKVYGEVWYTISIEYPVLDVITSETGNKKTLYSINFFNKSITLGKKYKNSSKKREYIFKNNIPEKRNRQHDIKACIFSYFFIFLFPVYIFFYLYLLLSTLHLGKNIFLFLLLFLVLQKYLYKHKILLIRFLYHFQ